MKGTSMAGLGLGALLLLGMSTSPAFGQGSAGPARGGAAALGPPVPAAQLADQRGGAESLTMNIEEITNEINESAALSDNSVGSNVTTGMNSITGGSFAGSSGITSVIQNTGNNVIIQDSTLVNITMRP